MFIIFSYILVNSYAKMDVYFYLQNRNIHILSRSEFILIYSIQANLKYFNFQAFFFLQIIFNFQVISKDTNVMLVALGGRLLGAVASGLRNKFSPYAVACIQAILDKFKEKKTNVVAAMREAIDAIYPCVSIHIEIVLILSM